MRVVLAIEAAIGGGSIALLSEGRVIGSQSGKGSEARSEYLLADIGELLDRSSVNKSSLTNLAVSTGPGSYTGIRVGLATAIGLGRSLNIPVAGISSLRALAASQSAAETIVLIPLGRNGYCWQIFSDPKDGPLPNTPDTGSSEDFLSQIAFTPHMTLIAHGKAFEAISKDPRISSRPGQTVNFGYDVAVAIGAATETIDEGLAPMYARETLGSPPS